MGVLLKPLSEDALERAARGMMSLTLSEYLVLRALLSGLKSDEIANETGLTKLTVQFYLKTIFKKCGCDRISLVRMAPRLERNDAVASYLKALAAGRNPPTGALGYHARMTQAAVDATVDDGHVVSSPRRGHRQAARRRPFKRHRTMEQ